MGKTRKTTTRKEGLYLLYFLLKGAMQTPNQLIDEFLQAKGELEKWKSGMTDSFLATEQEIERVEKRLECIREQLITHYRKDKERFTIRDIVLPDLQAVTIKDIPSPLAGQIILLNQRDVVYVIADEDGLRLTKNDTEFRAYLYLIGIEKFEDVYRP